ncbi:MAG: FKBP-type peptidyl-prolyl cis-trans isomerase [Bacteroidales bacterium]|nr:FKBP-type peptidyl-prolyl cis-trans isomerase [Bacteroidales bacterium]
MNLELKLEKISYSLGASVGQSLIDQGFGELQFEAFVEGLKDVYSNGKLKIDPNEGNKLLNEFMQEIQAKKGASAKVDGEKFLEENKKRKEVTITDSGLQYEVIEEGNGALPQASSSVTVHYHGTFTDGKVFDSSYDRNEPATFPVNGVIPGWTEALQLMKTGAKWRLFIPSHIAYGEQGAGASIPPHSALVFDVELISIN